MAQLNAPSLPLFHRNQPTIISKLHRSGTVPPIVTDMLSEILGFDKYSEVTSEHAIRGTACDLAIKLDGTVEMLIEIKAIGIELKDAHVKQAVDYASNQGVDWAILTNGINWRIYKVISANPSNGNPSQYLNS